MNDACPIVHTIKRPAKSSHIIWQPSFLRVILLIFHKRRETEVNQVQVFDQGIPLERNRVVKCLGVMLDDKLQWTDQVKEVNRKVFPCIFTIEEV